MIRSKTIEARNPPDWANARRWQSKKVLRSIEVVKQQELSRENATLRWKA